MQNIYSHSQENTNEGNPKVIKKNPATIKSSIYARFAIRIGCASAEKKSLPISLF